MAKIRSCFTSIFSSSLTKFPFRLSNSALLSCSMAHYDAKKFFVGDGQTKMYAAFRPSYPEQVFETIENFRKTKSYQNKLAIDIGCGPGQSTVPLTKYFSEVMGVDVSQQQISNAPKGVPGLSFHVSAAENLSFIRSSSTDLVTVAQTLHWLQLDRFYSEVDRILKPGGSFVAYGYGMMRVHHKEVHEYLMQIYYNDLDKYWAAGRKHIENKFSSLSLPYDGGQRNDSLELEKDWTIDQIIGYLISWSAVQAYNQANPNMDLIGRISKRLKQICLQDADRSKENVFKVTWPIFILMSHKPKVES